MYKVAFKTVAAMSLVATSAAAQPPVRYVLRIEDPSAQKYEIEADFPSEGEITELSLPAWTPGHYTIENYARFIGRFAAFDSDGRALRWDKLDQDTWRIESAGAERVRVTFDFFTDTLNLSGSLMHSDFSFFNGTNVFLFPSSGLEFESEVRFELPEGWRIATELGETADPMVFTAADYHELVDNPTFLGHFAIDSVRAGDRWTRLAVYPAAAMKDPARQMALDALEEIAVEMHEMFGEPPYERYTTLIYLAEGIPYLAGLEHSNSHLDILPAVAFEQPRLVFSAFIYRLLSHEYFHAWNVKRIRPDDMWPYAYDREQPTELLWVSEGITDYYAQVVLARTGIWRGQQLVESFETMIGNVEGQPEHEAVEDASLNAWIDPTFIAQDYYYDKGALIGLLLDIRIRDATEGRASLDDVMRRLYQEHYEAGRGFDTDDILGYISEHIGEEEAWGFYRDYIDGREPLPFEETLSLAGIHFSADTIVEPFFGVAVAPARGREFRVTDVESGSAAARAGIEPGDVLVSVGEIEIRNENWGAEFRRLYSDHGDEEIEVVFLRRGRERSGRTTIGTRTRYTHNLSADPNAGEKARVVREGILTGGKWR